MKFSEAFKEAMHRFNLKGTEISELSGVDPAQISKFRSGLLNMRIENLQKIVDAMPPEAREYMLLLVARGDIEAVPLPKKPDAES